MRRSGASREPLSPDSLPRDSDGSPDRVRSRWDGPFDSCVDERVRGPPPSPRTWLPLPWVLVRVASGAVVRLSGVRTSGLPVREVNAVVGRSVARSCWAVNSSALSRMCWAPPIAPYAAACTALCFSWPQKAPNPPDFSCPCSSTQWNWWSLKL
ncbi:hypothetical protein GCM10009635_32700 [Actinocatenispora thailandica]